MAIEDFTLHLKAQHILDERKSEVKEVHTYPFQDTWEPFGSLREIVLKCTHDMAICFTNYFYLPRNYSSPIATIYVFYIVVIMMHI